MEHLQEIDIAEVVAGWHCTKGFQCYKSSLRVVGKAEDIGLESYVRCLEEEPSSCSFSMPFGNAHFCRCRVRVYIKKRLGK